MRTSKIAQRMFNALLNTSSHGIINKIKLIALHMCRSWIIRMCDPLVTYKLNRAEILLPLSHNLPLYRKLFPEYSSNIARIARNVLTKYPDLTFIDIGANVGDTVAILRELMHFPILCIEGNDRFFSILQMNAAQYKDVYLEHIFVGSVTGRVKGRIESQGGTARLIVDETSCERVHVKTLSDILKTQPSFAQSKMIKVDTDGLDCHTLQNELELLGNLKPVLFFEYDPYLIAQYKEDGFKIFESLQSIGYKSALVYENNGDYLLTAELQNMMLMQDIHHFYSGRAGERYCDICAFHEDDSALCQAIRLAEIEFFDKYRFTVLRP